LYVNKTGPQAKAKQLPKWNKGI